MYTHLENVLHKKLLQILVGKVDAELLKAVGLKVLKAENVEHTDGALVVVAHVGLVDGQVDLFDDVHKQAAVDALGKGVPDVLGLVGVQGGHHRFTLSTRKNNK